MEYVAEEEDEETWRKPTQPNFRGRRLEKMFFERYRSYCTCTSLEYINTVLRVASTHFPPVLYHGRRTRLPTEALMTFERVDVCISRVHPEGRVIKICGFPEEFG